MTLLTLFFAVTLSLGIIALVALLAANGLIPALLFSLGVVWLYWRLTKPENAYFE